MDCRAVIFDLDGTLADTLADLGGAMNWALEQLGLPTHDLKAHGYFVGDGVANFAERALGDDRKAMRDALLEIYRPYYAEHCFDHTRAYDGIPELLDQLVARRVPMAVLSNKPHAGTQQLIARLFDRWDFAAVQGEANGVPRKPAPDGALRIAQELDVPPHEIMFVGDTRTDMDTAVAAGMFAVGVLWGFRDRDELLDHGAQALIQHPLELLPLMDTP